MVGYLLYKAMTYTGITDAIFCDSGFRGKCFETLNTTCLSYRFVPPTFNPLIWYFLTRIKTHLLLYIVLCLQSKFMTTYSFNGYFAHFKIHIKNSIQWISFLLSGIINKLLRPSGVSLVGFFF